MELIKVENIDHLKTIVKDQPQEFRLLLGGGICFSRKFIGQYDGKWDIFNYIDESRFEGVTDEQLSGNSNIGLALTVGALYWEKEEMEYPF